MLSQSARPYIDASVPVLREHGLAITTAFYRNMFNEYPELKNLFNMGNQAQGTQQQSLAAAVFAYAANIDNPDVLKAVISRIVHKHASLGIKAEHYPIVGRHLLGAIKETLDDAATPALLDAWEEAYTLLAGVLISEEQKLYGSLPLPAGQLREMQVMQISQESELVRSFKLIPVDNAPLVDFHPGQYVSVAVNFPDGTRQLRQYSLSDAPAKPYYRISVKKETGQDGKPSGRVSQWLHEHVKVNDRIMVSAPFGDFKPEAGEDETLVLISAGVGITPMISTLNHLADVRPQHKVIFAHASRSKSHHSHLVDIEAALESMPNLKVTNFYESLQPPHLNNENCIQGEMSLSDIPDWERDKAKVYLCGPTGFMKKQWQELLGAGIPVHRLHREVFGPDLLDNLK